MLHRNPLHCHCPQIESKTLKPGHDGAATGRLAGALPHTESPPLLKIFQRLYNKAMALIWPLATSPASLSPSLTFILHSGQLQLLLYIVVCSCCLEHSFPFALQDANWSVKPLRRSLFLLSAYLSFITLLL